MAKVFVGNLEERVSEKDLEGEFGAFGAIRSVWVARRPPGYGFIEFEDRRDALDSIRQLDGRNGWRVELSHRDNPDNNKTKRDNPNNKCCFECGQPGHFARECNLRLGHGHGHAPRRRRSPSPRYRRSPSPRPRRTRSPSRSPPPYRRSSPVYTSHANSDRARRSRSRS